MNYAFLFFFKYIKKSKHLSANYYQENKERPQRNLAKDIVIFLERKRKKCQYVREK